MFYVVQEYGPGIHKPPMLKMLSRPFDTIEEANDWKDYCNQTQSNADTRKIHVIFIHGHPINQSL